MNFHQIINLKNFLPMEIIQTFEIMTIFIFLYGIIFLLLTTSENKKIFQEQK